MSRLFRPTLELLKPHAPVRPHAGHRLNVSESPDDVPTQVKSAAAERLLSLDWSCYPDEAVALAAELSERDGWRASGLMLGNGAQDLAQLLIWSTVEPGDSVVLVAPGAASYSTQARAAGACIVEVPLRDRVDAPFRFDVERLGRVARDSAARLVLVGSPNNPTGTQLSNEDVAWLHEQTPGILAIDESWRDFAGQDLAPLLVRCERLVLLRTFSKAFAAAALRLGYLLASPGICAELAKVHSPYDVGAISAALARELLRHPELMTRRVDEVKAERERMHAALAAIPALRVEEAHANFVVVEHASRPARELAAELAKRGVLVRDLGSYPGCDHSLRISVGSREANDAAIAALVEVA